MSLARHLSSPASGPAGSRTASRLDRWLLGRVARAVGAPRLRYALGATHAGSTRALATVRFADRRTLLGMLVAPEVGFGDAWSDGRIEIDGDLVAALEESCRAPARPRALRTRLASLAPNTHARARRNVERHYDLGNDFFAEWLDRELVYTCAYFERMDAPLEEAQLAKMDLVCRKLALRPGETVFEAGCGWGALALHMARRYGVHVTACNLSREQLAWARWRAAEEGLEHRVTFLDADYREVEGRYDAFVSVGMLEHIGRRSFRDLAAVIDRLLEPERGRGLLHFIGRDEPRPLHGWIRRRIFPGAYPPALDEVIAGVLRPAHVGVIDVENLRRHYALTLDHWRRRFDNAVARGRVGGDARFRRGWRLYLAGSQAAFTTGWLQLFQVTFARRDDDTLPWTRAAIYRTEAGGAR